MKKTLLIIIGIVILILAIILGNYYSYKAQKAELNNFNLQYEAYLEKTIYGTEIATVINKAVDNNEKNEVEKEQIENDGKTYYFYKQNDINSIKVDVQVKYKNDNRIYKMESLYQGEITRFVQNYNSVLFKCTKIEYNKAGKVNYLLFEQISE